MNKVWHLDAQLGQIDMYSLGWKAYLHQRVVDEERRRREREGGKEQRQMYTVECAECGKETQVPFEPKGDRPVYCRDCFNARRNK